MSRFHAIRGELSEQEEEWFAELGRRAVALRHLLDGINADGSIARIDPGAATLVFLRFELFSTVLQLLHTTEYGWVNALDEYGDQFTQGGGKVIVPSLPTPNTVDAKRLGVAAQFLKARLDDLIAAFLSQSHPARVGALLRQVFVWACWFLVQIELEIGN